jgi:hypothetical protein
MWRPLKGSLANFSTRRGFLVSLLAGIGVLAVAVGSGLFSRAAHDRGYQQVVQWSRPDGRGSVPSFVSRKTL